MSDAPRPILLLGAGGQVGWELERTLGPLGRVLARSSRDLDLTRIDRVRDLIREIRPGLVVNAAAYTDVDRAETETAAAQTLNGTVPGVLAEETRRLGVPLVHYSTDYVFDAGADAARPLCETDPVSPVNAYGRSKLSGERAIAEVGGCHVILRTAWVYSARRRNFYLTMARLAREREELRVVADQHGSPTWARMIAEATACILARSWLGRDPPLSEAGGTYHLTAAGQTTWHGFAEAIVDHLAARAGGARPRVVPIETSEYPTPADRPRYSVLDNDAVAATFGVRLPDWRSQLRMLLATS